MFQSSTHESRFLRESCIKYDLSKREVFKKAFFRHAAGMKRDGSQTLSDIESDYLIRLGERIRARRQERGLGLEELATQAEVHRTHLWKIEKGRLNVRVITLHRLARVLNIEVDALLLLGAHPLVDSS